MAILLFWLLCPFDCTCIIHYTSSICKLSQIRHFFCTDDGQAGYVLHEQDQNATKDLNISASMIFRPMDLMKQMISVACGKEHALLLSSSGEVYSLGNGRYMVGSEIGWLFNTGSIWQSNTHLKFLVTSWPKVVARKCSPFFNGLGKKRMNALDILRFC